MKGIPYTNKATGMAVYLTVLLLISVNFLGVIPFGVIFNGTAAFILYLLWLVIGHFVYKPYKNWFKLSWSKYNWPAVVFIFGVFLSFIPASIFFGQSFPTSVIASRAVAGLLLLPFLFALRPGIRDIEKAATWFSIILIAVSIMDAIGIPLVKRTVIMSEDLMSYYFDDDSFVHLFPGFIWVAVAYIFKLDRFSKNPSLKNGLIVFVFLGFVFLLQNRTTLFSCFIMLAIMLLAMKSKDKIRDLFIKLPVFMIIIAAIWLTLPIWKSLFEETSIQLNDDNYNRIKALIYFFGEGCHGVTGAVLGNGFISSKTSSIMQDLMKEGIFNSDVGLIGTWNYYGLIPIAVIICIAAICLFNRKYPAVLRYNALFILLGSITIGHFESLDNLVWLSVFFYGYALADMRSKSDTQ